MILAAVVVVIVAALIALRRLGSWTLPIWGIMAAGAAVVLAGGAVSPREAGAGISWEVMGFLAAMFGIGAALEASGSLAAMAERWLGRVRSAAQLLARVLVGSALASALLMNDTVAIVGAPVVLQAARMYGLPPTPLLLGLAFGVTFGSVPSPIGNPQNLLIAVDGGLAQPFPQFARVLILPALGGLALSWLLLRRMVPAPQRALRPVLLPVTPVDPALARLCKAALILLVLLLSLRVAATAAGLDGMPGLPVIAGIAAAPLLLSPRRVEILRRLDWRTLVFFLAMFVVTAAVARTGLVDEVVDALQPAALRLGGVIAIALLGSQLVSNVPLVALYLPVLAGGDPALLLALAGASTVAGNATILGAASNVIVVQGAERQGAGLLPGLTFSRAGLPLALASAALVYGAARWLA